MCWEYGQTEGAEDQSEEVCGIPAEEWGDGGEAITAWLVEK